MSQQFIEPEVLEGIRRGLQALHDLQTRLIGPNYQALGAASRSWSDDARDLLAAYDAQAAALTAAEAAVAEVSTVLHPGGPWTAGLEANRQQLQQDYFAMKQRAEVAEARAAGAEKQVVRLSDMLDTSNQFVRTLLQNGEALGKELASRVGYEWQPLDWSQDPGAAPEPYDHLESLTRGVSPERLAQLQHAVDTLKANRAAPVVGSSAEREGGDDV